MINLIELLSEKDKNTIINYVDAFGCDKENFVGVDEWLCNWNCANQKLYKLLGNNLIVKIPYSCKKEKSTLTYQFKKLCQDSPFITSYNDIFYKYLYRYVTSEGYCSRIFSDFTYEDIYVEDSVRESFKINDPNKKGILQIQQGMKPVKALQKIMKYFSEYFTDEDRKNFEDFRLKHSLILNDKTISGNLVFSIHPLDYMTMSDNSLNWHSCMSWANSRNDEL